MGRTVSDLSAEAAATADQHTAAQAAVAANITADSGRRLESLSTTMNSCLDINQNCGQLSSGLADSVRSASQQQLAAVATMQANSTAWAGQLKETSDAAHSRTRDNCAAASQALVEKEAALKSASELASDQAAENSCQLELAVATDIGGRTAEFCGVEAAEVRQVLDEVEEFVSVRLREDQPTGATPGRLERSYPRYLAATSPHVRITERSAYLFKVLRVIRSLIVLRRFGSKLLPVPVPRIRP